MRWANNVTTRIYKNRKDDTKLMDKSKKDTITDPAR